MTQNDNAVTGLFLFLCERTAESGSNVESGKQICGDTGARDHTSAVAIPLAEQPDDLVTRSERFKCVISLSPIKKIGIRAANSVRSGGIRGRQARRKFQSCDSNQLLRIWERQWTQEDAVDEAEDRRRRTNTERQREHDGDRESGAAPKLPNGEAYVLRYRHRKRVLQHKVHRPDIVYVAGNCLVNIHEDKTR